MKLRMEGPYTADVPLQVVCYFKYTPEGAKRIKRSRRSSSTKSWAACALRERGEFAGDRLETLVIIPPARSIKAKALLLIGLGKEESLSLDVMERVGKVALREASRLGAARRLCASHSRPGKFDARHGRSRVRGQRGVLLAYDTKSGSENRALPDRMTSPNGTRRPAPPISTSQKPAWKQESPRRRKESPAHGQAVRSQMKRRKLAGRFFRSLSFMREQNTQRARSRGYPV